MVNKDAIDLIKERLQEEGRSMKWLSRETGIPYSSMAHYMTKFLKPKKPLILAMFKVLEIDEKIFKQTDYFNNQKHPA